MNSCRSIAAIAGLSCAIAGFAPVAGADSTVLAQAPDAGVPRPTPATPAVSPAPPAPATPPEADKPESRGGIGWYVGTGIGAGFGAKYKLNGQSISFDDRLQGATDKSPLIAFNIINAGITLGPSLLLGFSGSFVAQGGKIAGNDVNLQINNYFAAVTWFPAEQGFFVRGGGGLSNIVINTSAGDAHVNGYGILLGAGYALPIGRHNITFTVDTTRQFYNGSSTKPDSSQFSAVYLGYMYRH